jgi:uncharacterized protein YkvS
VGQSPETPTHSIHTNTGKYEGVPIMVNALLKNGTPVEFTLTGLSASVTKIDNNSVVFENEKGETIVSTLSDVESMLKAGTLKV